MPTTEGISKVYVDGSQAEQEMKNLKAQVDKYTEAMNKARKANDKAGFDKAKKQYNAANKELKTYKRTIYNVGKVLDNLSGTSYNTLMKVQRQLQRQIQGMNKNTKEEIALYKKKVGQLEKVKAETTKVRREMNAGAKSTQSWMSKMGNGFNKYSMLAASFLASITGIILSFRKAIDASNDFEASVSNLSAMTGLAGKELDDLSKRAMDLSGSTTEAGIRITQSAKDIVDGYILMGSARPELLKNADALAEVTKKAIILSEAQKMELKPAVDAVAATMNQFDLKAGQSTRIINTLAAGSLKGSAFVQDLTDSLKNVGTVAHGANMSMEQTVAMLEVMAKKQLKGEEAGTQLRSAILRLQAAGVGYKSGLFNITDALDEVNKKMAAYATQKEKDAYIQNIFGKRQITAGKIMLQNVGAYQKMTKAVTGTNTAMEQAAINTANNKAKLEAARATLNKMVIELGRKLTPALTFSTSAFSHLIRGVLTLTKFFNENRTAIISLTAGIAAYTIAVKVAKYWDDIEYAILVAKTAATKVYRTVVGLATGEIKFATLAQKAWNIAQKANPIGLIVGVIIAAVTALALYTRKLSAAALAQKAINDVTRDANKAIADQEVKLNILIKTAQDETKSKDERIAAIKKLNKLSPEYLGNLNLENIKTTKAKEATDKYIESLLKKAKVQAAEQKLVEIQKKLIDNQMDYQEEINGTINKTKTFGGVVSGIVNQQIKGVGSGFDNIAANTEKFNKTQAKLIAQQKILQKFIEGNNSIQKDTNTSATKNQVAEINKLQKQLVILENTKKAMNSTDKEGIKVIDQRIASIKSEIITLKKAVSGAKNVTKENIDNSIKGLKSFEEVFKNFGDKEFEAYKELQAKIKAAQNAIFTLSDETDRPDDPVVVSMQNRIKAIKKLAQHSSDDRVSIEKLTQSEIDKLHKNGAISDQEYADLTIQITKNKAAQTLDFIGQMGDTILWGTMNLLQAQMQALDTQHQKVMDRMNSESDALDKQKQRELKAAVGNAAKIDAINEKYAHREEQLQQKKAAADEAYRKKQNEIKHKEDVNNKIAAMFNVAINTAIAVAKVWGQTGIFGIAAQIPVLAMGAIEEAFIAAQPLPQYAAGNFMQVIGKNDNQKYNAVLGTGETGLYDQPTIIPGLGLVGERQKELVFSGPDTQKILNTPALVEALKMSIATPQYASGNAREIIRETNTQTFTDPALLELMQKINDKLDEPARAILLANENYLRTHKKAMNNYDNFLSKVGS